MRAIDSMARFVRFSASSLNFFRFSEMCVFVISLAMIWTANTIKSLLRLKYAPILIHITTEITPAAWNSAPIWPGLSPNMSNPAPHAGSTPAESQFRTRNISPRQSIEVLLLLPRMIPRVQTAEIIRSRTGLSFEFTCRNWCPGAGCNNQNQSEG